METSKRITKTTFKSFLKKNAGNVYTQILSNFSGMTDCVEDVEDELELAEKDEREYMFDHNLGITGIYLVGGGRDYFTLIDDDKYFGYQVSNCCGSSIAVIKK